MIELRFTGEDIAALCKEIQNFSTIVDYGLAATPGDVLEPAEVEPAQAPPPPAPAPLAVVPTPPIPVGATVTGATLTMPPATTVAILAPIATESAAATPVTVATPATEAIVLDGEGLPHDPRIHSAKPTLKGDGKWRGKRGLADNAPGMLEQVTAELRLTYPAPTAAVTVPAEAAPPAAAPPVAVVPPVAAVPVVTVSLDQVIGLASAVLGHAKTPEELQTIGTLMKDAGMQIGLAAEHNTNDLIARPDLYAAAYQGYLNVAAEIGLPWPPAPAAVPIP